MNVLAASLREVDPSEIPFAAALGVGLICLYYLAVWFIAGRNPGSLPIVAHYDPPRDISPALMRYVLIKGFDEKCFSSALLNMAAKSYVQFERQPGGYQLSRGPAEDSVLSADEKVLGALLLGRGFNLRLNADHRERVSLAVRAMDEVLQSAVVPAYLREPRNLLLPAMFGSALVLAIWISLSISSIRAGCGLARLRRYSWVCSAPFWFCIFCISGVEWPAAWMRSASPADRLSR